LFSSVRHDENLFRRTRARMWWHRARGNGIATIATSAHPGEVGTLKDVP